jgi:hypothetical protein
VDHPRHSTPAVLILTDLLSIARHLSLLTEAERRGLHPLLVFGPDTPVDQLAAHRRDPGHPVSRLRGCAQVEDYRLDTVLSVLRPRLSEYRIHAVLACGEAFVEAAGTLAETLGLPGPGTHAAHVSRHKMLQRLAVPALSPRWTALESDTAVDHDTWLGFPAVLKPVGRMCSSGVREVSSLSELAEVLPGYPLGEPLLLEERVMGPEFSVEALVACGSVVWAGITAKRTNEEATCFFTETGHTSPAPGLSGESEEQLLAANRLVLEAIHFGSGITHAEFRLCGDRVVLMEIAARLPGDAITRLWHLAHAEPLEPAVLDLALGIRPGPRTARRRAQQFYLDHPPGTLADVVVEDVGTDAGAEAAKVTAAWTVDEASWPQMRPVADDAPPALHAVVVGRQRGDLLGEATESGGRSVSVIVDGPLDAGTDAFARRVAQAVRIRTVQESAEAPGTTPSAG